MNDKSNLDITNPETWPYVLDSKSIMMIAHIKKSKFLLMVANNEIPVKKIRGRYSITKDALIKWLQC